MRKGFTLIELIFVIVIIGVLAAVAIPKYQNLQQNAEINNMRKIVNDSMSSIPSTYVNAVDLDGTPVANVKMRNLVDIKGKGWVIAETSATSQTATYTPDGASAAVAVITLNPTARTANFTITCASYPTGPLLDKCNEVIKTASDQTGNVTF